MKFDNTISITIETTYLKSDPYPYQYIISYHKDGKLIRCISAYAIYKVTDMNSKVLLWIKKRMIIE
jgi:hypothetical protein